MFNPIPRERMWKSPRSRFPSTRWEIAFLIWIHQKSPAPMEFLRAFLKRAASRSRKVFVPYLITPYVLGAFLLFGSQLILLQFTRKIFGSQLKIIDQFHYFKPLWNAAFLTGFIPMSRSQLHLYNTDSCAPVRALRNFSVGKALDKNRQIFCTLNLPRLSTGLTMPLILKSWNGKDVAGQLLDWFSDYFHRYDCAERATRDA